MADLLKIVAMVIAGILAGCREPAQIKATESAEDRAIDEIVKYSLPEPAKDTPSDPNSRYAAKIIRPDDELDHLIITIVPDPNADHKIRVFPPESNRLMLKLCDFDQD